MQTNQLKRAHPNTKRMIVARGGKRGKTAGRGGKGQSARAGNKRRPEWRDIIKKLPKLRGRGVNSNKGFAKQRAVINVGLLEQLFSANEAVNPITLSEKGAISTRSGNLPAVKILGEGEITKALKISGCHISESAKMKVEKAGGSVVVLLAQVMINSKPVVTKEMREARKVFVPKAAPVAKKEVKVAPKAAKK